MFDKVTIENGIDRISDYLSIFEDKKVGLITNPTGCDKQLVSTVDILNEKVNLQLLFAPEHGLRGDAQAGSVIENSVDPFTNVPIISLYGEKKAPTPEELAQIDVLVYDIQDVGIRYYTYIYTMILSMMAAKKAGISFVVLDRLNVLGARENEGTILDDSISSFVGMLPIPVSYGLTCGELALYMNEKLAIDCDLTVIPIKGWDERVAFNATDLCWVSPSPNLPNFETALLYSGTCLFEGTNLSEGRGTAKPFKQFGAPWLDNNRLVKILNDKKYPGLLFQAVFFTPTFSKHQGELCRGIETHVVDEAVVQPWSIVTEIMQIIAMHHEAEFDWHILSPDLGTETFLTYLSGYRNYLEKPLEVLIKQQQTDRIKFEKEVKKYYLYK